MSYPYRYPAPCGPVHYATFEEKREIRLIECNVEIWKKCRYGTFEEVLRVKSPDDGVTMIHHPSLDKEQLLEAAIRSGMSEVIQYFVTHDPEFIRAYDFRQTSNVLIKFACIGNKIEVVKLLMDPGIGNLNTDDITMYHAKRDGVLVYSALGHAARNDCLNIVMFFADEGFITQHVAQETLEQLQKDEITNSCIDLLCELANPRVEGAMN